MRSTFFSIVALMLLLAGNVLASWGCYSGGPTWGEVGTEDEVNNALGDLCKILDGDCALKTERSACLDVNGFAIHGHIAPMVSPTNHDVTIIQESCLDLMNSIKDLCVHGGRWVGLRNHPEKGYGGDFYRSNVILDPNRGIC